MGCVIEWKGIFIIAALFLCHAALTQDMGKFWRLFAVLLASLLSFGLLSHMVVGFHNILLLKSFHSSKDALGMNLYLNYDKPFIGIFVLAFSFPLIREKKRWITVFWQSILWVLFSSPILLGLAHILQCVRIEPKIPSITLLWIVIQIFFVVIPEEAFFRGFLQKEIAQDLDNRLSGIFAIFVVAILAALMHLFFIQSFSYLTLVFVANILYGTIFLLTKSIESAMITHFLTNAIHFFFFTYPLLAPSS
jgi:membrane protease YdiL (CAAX protease family)